MMVTIMAATVTMVTDEDGYDNVGDGDDGYDNGDDDEDDCCDNVGNNDGGNHDDDDSGDDDDGSDDDDNKEDDNKEDENKEEVDNGSNNSDDITANESIDDYIVDNNDNHGSNEDNNNNGDITEDSESSLGNKDSGDDINSDIDSQHNIRISNCRFAGSFISSSVSTESDSGIFYSGRPYINLPIVPAFPRPDIVPYKLPDYKYLASQAPFPVRDSIVTYETMDTQSGHDLIVNNKNTEPFFASKEIVSLQSHVKRGRGLLSHALWLTDGSR